MGTLKEKFRKCFQKPWGSIYFNEMFSKKCFEQRWLVMKEKGVVVLKRTLVIMYSPGAIELCSHITPVWDGA
jgi:hypothetical protein